MDTNKKLIRLYWFWIKRLYDYSFHEWKLVPLQLIEEMYGDDFKFQSNLSFDICFNKFPEFYEDILRNN